MSELEVLPPELEDLANEVGDFICYWGFKKIHGRLWTHIYLSRDPLDAGQLMQRLRVSTHGLAINVHNDLNAFGGIRACGRVAARMDRVHTDLTLAEVFEIWVRTFKRELTSP